jgi:hypothetical protein
MTTTYPGTTTPIETGDYIVYAVGPRETWDWGRVDEVDGDAITVSWQSSLQGTTQPADALRGVDVYTDPEAARRAWADAMAD